MVLFIDNFWVFALAGLMLNITPGNDMLYVIARSTSQGVKAGIVSSLGVMAGCLVHVLFAVFGVSALIANSALAFSIIKYTGAAYLLYLGIKALLSKESVIEIKSDLNKISYSKMFWQGVVTNALNPKVAMFFLAFLPQFVDVHHGNTAMQFLFLGVWFDVSGTLVNILVAVLFGKIGAWLSKSAKFVKWQYRLTGSLLIALGIKVAMSSRK